MEGSAEDPGEWELADLNDSMFRLMLSSKKSSDSSTPPQSTLVDFVEEAPLLPDSVASSFASSGLTERRRGPSEEVFSQVDQFLREALEKPRERLWSICKGLTLDLDLVEDLILCGRCFPLLLTIILNSLSLDQVTGLKFLLNTNLDTFLNNCRDLGRRHQTPQQQAEVNSGLARPR